MPERNCNYEARGNTCYLCLFDHNGDCAREQKPGRVPWPAWRDVDMASTTSQERQQRVSLPDRVGNTLTDKVQQLTGLTQYLRNEVSSLKERNSGGVGRKPYVIK